MRTVPVSPPNPQKILLQSLPALVPGVAIRGQFRENDSKAVLVRADLQGQETPISWYARVGLTALATRSGGEADLDAASEICAAVMRALIDGQGTIPGLIRAEYQSGPVEVTDAVQQKPVMYSTMLLVFRASQ